MPLYEFQCSNCNLKFSRPLKIGEHKEHVCPNCGHAAQRLWTGFSGHDFALENTTTNSGVHDIDYPTADKAVGRSSYARWEKIHERAKVKQQAREAAGSSPLIRRDIGNGVIEYEGLSTSGKSMRKKIAKDVFKKLTEQKK